MDITRHTVFHNDLFAFFVQQFKNSTFQCKLRGSIKHWRGELIGTDEEDHHIKETFNSYYGSTWGVSINGQLQMSKHPPHTECPY